MSEKGINIFSVVVILLLSSSLLFSSENIKLVYAQAGQVTLVHTDDTFVSLNFPTSNYDAAGSLGIANGTSIVTGSNFTDVRIAWLKFDLSSIPEGAVIDNSTLQLFTEITEIASPNANVSAHFCPNNSWNQAEITYYNMPNYTTASLDSVLVPTSQQWYSWNVTDALENALKANLTSLTIVLSEPFNQPNGVLQFYSQASNGPKLTVHWTGIVPEFPAFLVLSLLMIITLIAVAFHKREPCNTESFSQAERGILELE